MRASASHQIVRCSASSPESETRLSFLHKSVVRVAAAAAAVSFGSPLIVLADDEEEVKVGEEVTSDSGLKYVVTKAGTGAKPNPGDFVKAHYTGLLRVLLVSWGWGHQFVHGLMIGQMSLAVVPFLAIFFPIQSWPDVAHELRSLLPRSPRKQCVRCRTGKC